MSQTLSGVPLVAIDPIAVAAPPQIDAAPPVRPPGTIEHALGVVLGRTRRGSEELIQHRFNLGTARRQLLGAVDGVRTLGELTQPDAAPNAQRLVSDAARLVAFGLCRSVRGELPQRFMVAAMNLTLRLPRLPVGAAAPAGDSDKPLAEATAVAPHKAGQREGRMTGLQLAASLVAALLLAWIVFEIARA